MIPCSVSLPFFFSVSRNGKGLSWKGKDEHKNALMLGGNIQSAIWSINYGNTDVVKPVYACVLASKNTEV